MHGGLLTSHRLLHLVQKTPLNFLETLDVLLSHLSHFKGRRGFHFTIASGVRVVIMPVLFHFLHHHLPLVVGIGRVLGLLVLAGRFLGEELLVVGAQELVHVFARFATRVKVAVALALHILVDLVALVRVFSVLPRHAHLLHLIAQVFVSIVVIFTLANTVSKLRVFVCELDLLLKIVFLDFQFADSVLQ